MRIFHGSASRVLDKYVARESLSVLQVKGSELTLFSQTLFTNKCAPVENVWRKITGVVLSHTFLCKSQRSVNIYRRLGGRQLLVPGKLTSRRRTQPAVAPFPCCDHPMRVSRIVLLLISQRPLWTRHQGHCSEPQSCAPRAQRPVRNGCSRSHSARGRCCGGGGHSEVMKTVHQEEGSLPWVRVRV